MPRSVVCPNCADRQMLGDDFSRPKVRCPTCGTLCEVPAPSAKTAADPEEDAARLLGEPEPPAPSPRRQPALPPAPKAAANPAPPPLPPPEPSEDGDDDNGRSYIMQGGEDRKCSACFKVIDKDAVVCVFCGLDFRKGKKHKQTYDPLERGWDLGMQMSQRQKFFAIGVVLGLAASLILATTTDSWTGFLTPWLFSSAMLAFLLGTFFHIDLIRDRKGRVKLIRTWRIAFVPRPSEPIDLSEIVGIRAGVERDAGFLEWFICLDLLLMGLLPGILFYSMVINRDKHVIQLTRIHGHAETYLYRGIDEELAKEIVGVVRDAAKLREELE